MFMATSSVKQFASGSEDGKVYIWDLQTKQVIQRLDGHTNVVLAVVAHPTERVIASTEWEKVKLWNSGENDQSHKA